MKTNYSLLIEKLLTYKIELKVYPNKMLTTFLKVILKLLTA